MRVEATVEFRIVTGRNAKIIIFVISTNSTVDAIGVRLLSLETRLFERGACDTVAACEGPAPVKSSSLQGPTPGAALEALRLEAAAKPLHATQLLCGLEKLAAALSSTSSQRPEFALTQQAGPVMQASVRSALAKLAEGDGAMVTSLEGKCWQPCPKVALADASTAESTPLVALEAQQEVEAEVAAVSIRSIDGAMYRQSARCHPEALPESSEYSDKMRL